MINLLPPAIKDARRYGRRNKALLSYTISIAAIAVLSIGVILFNTRFVSEDKAHLQAEMLSRAKETTSLEAGQKDVEKIAAELKIVDKLYSGQVRFSQLIPKIGGLLPGGAVLTSLSLNGSTASPLQLSVKLESQDLAAVFLKNLVNSDLFDQADISNITSVGTSVAVPGKKSYPYSATLTAAFKGSKKPVAKTGTTP